MKKLDREAAAAFAKRRSAERAKRKNGKPLSPDGIRSVEGSFLAGVEHGRLMERVRCLGVVETNWAGYLDRVKALIMEPREDE